MQLRVAGLEYRDIYRRNLRLVDWRLAPALPKNYEFEMNAAKRDAFEATCDEWGITTGFLATARKPQPGNHMKSVPVAIKRALSAAACKSPSLQTEVKDELGSMIPQN